MERRWSIAILITAAIAISYLDRQTLPVAVDAIRQDIPISDVDYSHLNVAFLLAYAAMYMGGGRLIDTLGTRRGFFLIMVFWSLACAGHGLATGFWMLAASRLLLGVGEGGGFPAATKAVAEWFPVRERSTAMGMINAELAVGAVIAPPAMAAIIAVSDWRWVFFSGGAAGLVWSLWWLWEYRPPEKALGLSDAERSDILARPRRADAHERASRGSICSLTERCGMRPAQVLERRRLVLLHRLVAEVLVRRPRLRHQSGRILRLDSLRGGRRRQPVGRIVLEPAAPPRLFPQRRPQTSAGASAALMPWVFFVTRTEVDLAIVLFSVAFFGQQSWSTLVMTLPTDLFPQRVVGSVAGLVGFGGAMGGVIFNLVVGEILQHRGLDQGYEIVFAISSSLHVLAFLLILATIRRVAPLEA